ncbi:DUF3611 family protein [Gloeocapsa sp. PCC 73106]|uniref:DUF3611 family protein n=1 Tax=Gloeocapsa sp. PCC 73106 TaxID=102232 RepID=UPI0002ACBA68|nr:DUF3611 family protein [Gloeocapsa sp. PCC 73106]ELR96255.1 Protein of unknown function (DUF3611) [Gloeocapsa sp. PCC 73106]
MTRDSEISRLIPNGVEKVVNSLKRASIIGFWLQIILGVIAGVTLLFASPILISNQDRNQGNTFGVLCALFSLILLGIGIFFSFRYGKVAKKIQTPDPTLRPKKSETIKMIRFGLIINLVGMFLATVGAQALVGIVLAKSLARPQVAFDSSPTGLVNSLDLLIIQANTNTITAHFSGIITSLWLLGRVAR